MIQSALFITFNMLLIHWIHESLFCRVIIADDTRVSTINTVYCIFFLNNSGYYQALVIYDLCKELLVE